MPRSDLFPPDIMDKHAAFAGAINQYLRLVQDWEIRRFDPNQPRIPAGQPNAGQWQDETGGDPTTEETPDDLTPTSDSPQATPAAAANGGPPRFQVSLRPADIPKPDDLLLSEVGRGDPTAAMLARYAKSMPTYFAMYGVPTFLDPTVGFPKSTDKVFNGPADLTRFGVRYYEAYRFDTFKDQFFLAFPRYQFHHIVEQTQYLYFTDRPNDPRAVHNSSNIVILHEDIHTCVSTEFSKTHQDGMTLREFLKGKPFLYQYQIGLDKIKECSGKPDNQSSTESATDRSPNSETTIFPPLPIPLRPPRPRLKQEYFGDHERAISFKGAWGVNKMSIPSEELDIGYLLSLLEQFDDVSYENDERSAREGNVIVTRIWRYFKQFSQTEEFWRQVTPLLFHPRKMVRVWIATEMLLGGRKEAWPIFIANLFPDPNRAQFPRERINKEFAAESFASTFILMKYQHLDALGVTPSLSELEDQWIAEGRRTRRFPRFS